MEAEKALVINTATRPGSLARLIASRVVDVSKLSGPKAAATIMLAQFPLSPSLVKPGPSTKKTIAQRRLARMRKAEAVGA